MKIHGVPGYPYAQPGDIYFARGTASLSKAIRWVERSKGEDESWANHVGGILTPGYLVPPANQVTSLAIATESLWHIEENVWWHRHRHEQGYAVAVFRPRNYSGNEGVKRATDNWSARRGQRYGWWRMGTFLGERLTGGLIPFSKLHFSKTRVVCSNHIALGLEEDNIRINDHDPNELDPDEFMDYSIAHESDEFKFIGQAIVPARRVA
jgi:hypothetical protein